MPERRERPTMSDTIEIAARRAPAAPLPLGGARYTSRACMEAEWENVFASTWMIAVRADELPEPGDFMVEEIGRESILIVRQEDGGIKAFYNVCPHRGNRLVLAPE